MNRLHRVGPALSGPLIVLLAACGPASRTLSLSAVSDVVVRLTLTAPWSDAPTTADAVVHLAYEEPAGGCGELNLTATIDGQAGAVFQSSTSASPGRCASTTFQVKGLTPASTTAVELKDSGATVRATLVDACTGLLVLRTVPAPKLGEPVDFEYVASAPLDSARVQVSAGDRAVPFSVAGNRLGFTLTMATQVKVWRAGWSPTATSCHGAARCEANCGSLANPNFALFTIAPASP